jgi:hypothetical protein
MILKCSLFESARRLVTLLWFVCLWFPDVRAEETTASLNHFPEAVSTELVCIADWLIMHNRDEYMNVYARVRATILLKSLQQLKEQQRSSSGGSIQGVPVASSPMVVSFIAVTAVELPAWTFALPFDVQTCSGAVSPGVKQQGACS